MLEEMLDLLDDHDHCVLATFSGDLPHTSLMAYICDTSEAVVYMVTARDTRKYNNIMENPSVSLMVDTRCETEEDQPESIRALSVDGICRPVVDNGRHTELKLALAQRHPHLVDILEDHEAVVLQVEIQGLLLLDGPVGSTYLRIE